MESNPYQSPNPVTDPRLFVEAVPPRDGWKWVLAGAVIVALSSCVPILNFPPLVFLGWAASRAWPQTARVIAQVLPVAAGAVLAVLLISGLPPGGTGPRLVHRWAGHGIVTLLYVGVAFSLGVLLRQKIMRHPLLAIAQSLGLLFCLAISLSASFTGYLDAQPSPDPIIAEENHSRFLVLHMFLLPMILFTMLVVWHIAFWSRRSPENA